MGLESTHTIRPGRHSFSHVCICWVMPQPGCYQVTCRSDPSVGPAVFVAMANCTTRTYGRHVPGGMCTGWAWHTSASIKHSSVDLCGFRRCTLWLGTRDDIVAHHGSLRYKCGCVESRKTATRRDPMERDVADRGATVSNLSGDTGPRGAQ